MPIWTCEMTTAIDIAFVRDDEVVALAEAVRPCPAPCANCETFGDGVVVDGVLEVLPGRFTLEPGSMIRRIAPNGASANVDAD